MKSFQIIFGIWLFSCMLGVLTAQPTFPKKGTSDERSKLFAFTNATIHARYDQQLEKASLLIRDGRIEAIGTNITIPKEAIVQNLEGQHIYPALIDIYTQYGLPEAKAVGKKPKQQPQMLSNKAGAYSWNEALRTEFRASEAFKVDDKAATAFRKAGFGAVLTHQMDGISRGSAAFVLLGSEKEHRMLLHDQTAHPLSFRKGKSTQNYPTSLMGMMALLRQTYLDGEWYKKNQAKEGMNLSLKAWNELQALPQIFVIGNKLEALRAANLGKELGVRYLLKGTGDEYQRLDAIKQTGCSFILPLNFPKAYDLSDPFDAMHVSLRALQHWEQAPTNPARLANAGIELAFTTNGLKSPSELWKQIRLVMENGLTEEAVLKALTYTPAKMLRMEQEIGSLEKGKVANFLVCSKSIGDKEMMIYQNWINGKAYEINPIPNLPAEGAYELKVGPSTYLLHVQHQKNKAAIKLITADSVKTKVGNTLERNHLQLDFALPTDKQQKIRLAGLIQPDGEWAGKGVLANGQWVNWSAKRTGNLPEKKTSDSKKSIEKTPASQGTLSYPFGAYGFKELPTTNNWLIRNATVWTNEAEGKLTETDVLIKAGKIAAIGKGLSAGGAQIVDGTGKHLTAGMIDEHSHIAIHRGVNESSQASTAEVRIGDVINSEDINIYRQLSGGVTTSQLLHGSANPIGGQSALIKLRWGYEPEGMKFKNADPFIKFALGENVKMSNWGDEWNIRFPQTRMGVEQVFEDHFTRAREYGELKRSGKAYRKDLELETLLEILESRRFITCHSYQQGEINMLMKVAERHGFRVNTFTHILEGYKVADKMAKHGAGGSTFSDWWAYKYEVIDAIPYNGAIMHRQGVLTAFNSDDVEMARRLNQEAGKAVMYGDVSEEEALKFVTLNPAKLLHIDDRVGSIKVGKEADLALWSDHPLSVYAKAEKTMIDGLLFFDRERDKQLRESIREERARLVQKSLSAKSKGVATQPVKAKHDHHYHCDDLHDEGN